MPRQVQTQVQQRQVYEPISAPQATQVVARPTDQLALPIQDPELLGLVRGLATFQPSLQRYAVTVGEVDANRDMLAGKAARQQGKPLEKGSSGWFKHSYMMSDGQVKGDVDGQGLLQAYETGFDKDTGNIDDFIRDHFQANTKGLNDESYMQGYNESIAPHIEKIRVGQLQYQQEKIVQKVESNGMYKMGKAFQTRLDAGQPITVDDLEVARVDLNSNFGVSNTRFNDLAFNALDSLGKQGNYAVYDVLKEKKPDGTPGMYNIPEWKAKIDAAQIHSHSVFMSSRKASDAEIRQAREEKQNITMLDIGRLAETDMAAADVMFEEKMVQTGLVHGLKEYTEWKKMYQQTGNREATGAMQVTEMELQKGIYMGKITSMNQIANSDTTPQQKRSLMGELNRFQAERRREAADGVTSQYATLKTPHYKEGDDYIVSHLKPVVGNPMDFDKTEYEYDTRALAATLRAYQDAALTVKDPKELRNISYNLVTEAQKRREAVKETVGLKGAGRIRYPTVKSLQDAYTAGKLTRGELAVHIEYLEEQKRNPTVHATK